MWVFKNVSLFFVGLTQLKNIPLLPELELFIKSILKTKGSKLFPRDAEEKKIRDVEDSDRKNNTAVFHIL